MSRRKQEPVMDSPPPKAAPVAAPRTPKFGSPMEHLERGFNFSALPSWTRVVKGKTDDSITDLLADEDQPWAALPALGKLVVGMRTLSTKSDAFELLRPIAAECGKRSEPAG